MVERYRRGKSLARIVTQEDPRENDRRGGAVDRTGERGRNLHRLSVGDCRVATVDAVPVVAMSGIAPLVVAARVSCIVRGGRRLGR